MAQPGIGSPLLVSSTDTNNLPGTSSIASTQLGFSIADEGARGGAGADCTQALRRADTKARAVGGHVVIPPDPRGAFRIDESVTVQSPVQFMPGGKLRRATGVTVTFAQPFRAPLLSQIFEEETAVDGAAFDFDPGSVTLITPEWWGASTGADDTAAFKAAYAATQSAVVQSSSGPGTTSGVKPTLFLAPRTYTVTADISNGVQVNYLVIAGNKAIVEVGAGATFLGNIRYMVDLENVTIRGGAKALSIATGNTDTAMVTATGCEFHVQTSAVIDVDNNSNSMQVVIQSSKIVLNTAAAKVLTALSGDYIRFWCCWVTVATAAASAFDITNCALVLDNVVGVPNGLHSWVTMRGSSSLYIGEGSRLGGESGGAQTAAVVTEDTPNAIVIERAQVYVTSTAPVLLLNAIPKMVVMRYCFGLSDSDPIEIGSGVSAAQLAAIGGLESIFDIQYNSLHYNVYIEPDGSPVIARESLPLVHDRRILSGRPNVADLALQTQGNTGAYGVATSGSATASNTTDEFGVPIKQFVASAHNQDALHNFTTMLNGLAAGVYTAVFDIVVTTSTTVRPYFRASNFRTGEFTLPKGHHSICIPFYYDAGAAQTVGVEFYGLPNGATIQVQRIRLYHGRRHVAGRRVELEGGAAPAAGQYYVGDIVWHTTPAASGNIGWVCTTAGTPGTWKTFGSIAA